MQVGLFLYGPGHAGIWNLTRKIIKGGTYKNWRLNGEYITNPHDTPTRFNVLVPGDFAIFDFEGELFPTAARVVFVARNLAEDAALHRGLSDVGIGSMAAMELSRLGLVVHAAGVPESHPVFELLLDAAIEDAAQGGIEGTRKLLSRKSGGKMTRAALERARQRTADIGQMGEELINGYFAAQKAAGALTEFEWVAADNAISPFDFLATAASTPPQKFEVKSTCGPFGQIIHVSTNQLLEMQAAEPYCLYRVYSLGDHTAKLRIARDLKAFADAVVQQLNGLPTGVKADGVSVRPDVLTFGDEIAIDLTGAEEEDDG